MRKVINVSVSLIITAIFVLLGFVVFKDSYIRLAECVGDLFTSVGYYFCNIFGLENTIVPTVINPSYIMQWQGLPQDVSEFLKWVKAYFDLLFNAKHFMAWIGHICGVIAELIKILTCILPLLSTSVFIIKQVYKRGNTNYNVDTIPLRIFKGISKMVYQPLKLLCISYTQFLRDNKWIYRIWIVGIIFHLNLASIVVELIAYYLFFVTSYRLDTLWPQVYKTAVDLQVLFKTLPSWVFGIIVWICFLRLRKNIALKRLWHMEARNCGFINELPIVSMTCGSMGKKKTTVITDMALSQAVMFRQKAFEILQKQDIKFPYFPWICFEQELKRCMEHGTVYNLATAKEWVKLKRKRYEKHNDSNLQLYGYDVNRYGLEYNDGLRTSNLFEVLKTYAQAYFIYVLQSSLVIANYSIRTDNEIYTKGNFPLWDYGFFSEEEKRSRFAHILDFDTLRLGKKVLEKNAKAGSFEFGVVVITEIGKERGNNLELKDIKRYADETNQKNDLFNSWLKMCRHSATVDNFPFIKVFTDEQRPESWGADARELCDILNIISSSEQKLALPFYTLEEMLCEWAFNRFINLYYGFRYNRGDNTLLVHILKTVTAALYRHNVRVYNRYGYSILKVEKERGTQDEKIEDKKYFIMNGKIYNRRFTTDCFSDYFNDLAKKAKIGLMDYVEYATEKASVEEMKMQNSYFINGLYKDAE